jgi:hypothetical protein
MAIGLPGTYKYSQYAFLTSEKYPAGIETDPDNVTAPTLSDAHLYDKPIDVSGMTITYGKIQGLGGGRIWTQKVTGVTDIGDVTLNLSALDTTLETFWNGTSPDTATITNVEVVARNTEFTNFPNMINLHAVEFCLDDGSSVWLNLIYLNVQHKDVSGISSSQGDGQNPNPLAREFTPNRSTRTAWGELWSAYSAIEVENDVDYTMAIISPNPLALASYWDDGIATTFTVGRQLSSATVANHFIFKNGVDNGSGVTTIVPTTGVFTITPGTADDIWTILYQTDNFKPV